MDSCRPPTVAVEEDGFVILPGVLASQDVAELVQGLGNMMSRRSRAGLRHALKCSPVQKLARDPRLIGIAQAVLGDGAFPFRATLFDKSPVSNWLVVWHQDTALPLRAKKERAGWGPWSVKDGITYAHAPANALAQVLALRIHLDDSVAENGPLRVLRGTHKMGILSDDAIHSLAERLAPVDCLVSSGGVLAMHPLLVHASSKSRSALSRRVLHVEYAASVKITGDDLDLAVA